MTATRRTAAEAVSAIRSGDTVMVGGFGLVGAPLTLIDALVEESDATDLTIVSNNIGEPGRVRDEVREALERDGVAVADECADRLVERLDQNGNGCGAPTVIQCVSVNSSITALPPKRPIPLSLTPPKGICGSSPTGWSFTWTMPAWMR